MYTFPHITVFWDRMGPTLNFSRIHSVLVILSSWILYLLTWVNFILQIGKSVFPINLHGKTVRLHILQNSTAMWTGELSLLINVCTTTLNYNLYINISNSCNQCSILIKQICSGQSTSSLSSNKRLVLQTCAAAHIQSMWSFVMRPSIAKKFKIIWLCLIICK